MRLMTWISVVCLAVAGTAKADDLAAPKVGEKAGDFTLSSLDGKSVHFADVTKEGPVVLIMLRGWPGYQCPACQRQMGDFLKHADEFHKAGARVLMVYPGPANGLTAHAEEFVGSTKFPKNVTMLLDPDYKLTTLYGLRWVAPRETAYPSTFVVGPDNTIHYAKISRTHGGRAAADEVLAAVHKLQK